MCCLAAVWYTTPFPFFQKDKVFLQLGYRLGAPATRQARNPSAAARVIVCQGGGGDNTHLTFLSEMHILNNTLLLSHVIAHTALVNLNLMYFEGVFGVKVNQNLVLF